MLADWYDGLEMFLSRADTLAKLQTLWGDANVANKIPVWIEGVTSADIQRVAKTYLTDDHRTVIDREPAAMLQPQPAAPAAKNRGARTRTACTSPYPPPPSARCCPSAQARRVGHELCRTCRSRWAPDP